jgi:predicted PhzF superfamily epimerase YddE/YHI9
MLGMDIPIFQVDAFTDVRFRGNPAAVCLLAEWLPDEVLQNIAAENNLSETAFVVGSHDPYSLRWFTPTVEVDLCGHATLAAAYVYRVHLDYLCPEMHFATRSGTLSAAFDGDTVSLLFPKRPAIPCDAPDGLLRGVGKSPLEVLKSARDYLVVLGDDDEVKNLRPVIEEFKISGCIGVIVTARGRDVDFVSRFFAPNAGVAEDPVTGSSHSTLVPYWSQKLRKKVLTASQLSKRGGRLYCEDLEDGVKIAGKAVTYLKGSITV